jgi:hypothetical protein
VGRGVCAVTALRIKDFKAMFPRLDKRQLGETAAQFAQNSWFTSGRLDPFFSPYQGTATKAGTVRTIYNLTTPSGSNSWLSWTEYVDVCRAPISGDTTGRTYYTSASFEPRQTNYALATAGSPTPYSWYVLGVTPPVTAPTFTSITGGSGMAETRTYVYTFVTQWGEESAPSPPMTLTTGYANGTWNIGVPDVAPPNTYTITALAWGSNVLTATVSTTLFGLRAGEYVTLSGMAPSSLNASFKVIAITDSTHFTMVLNSNPGTITDGVGTATRDAPHNTTSMKKRVYRTITTSTGTDYYLVNTDDTLAVATTTYADATAGTAVGESIPTVGWVMPPVDLQGVCIHASGALAGFSGNNVCFSEPNIPYAWPVDNRISLDFPVVSIATFGQSVVAGTSGVPYVVSGVDPASMSSRRLEQAWPCLSKYGMVSFGDAAFYPTTLGIASIGSNGVSIVTQGLYSQVDWAALNPSTMYAAHFNNTYYAFYTNSAGGTSTIAISPEFGVTNIDLTPTTLFSDPTSGKLYSSSGGYVWELNSVSGGRTSCNWTSKEFLIPTPTSLGVAKIEGDFSLTADEAAAATAANAAVKAANQTLLGYASGNGTSTNTLTGCVDTFMVNGGQVDGTGLTDLPYASTINVTFTLYTNSAQTYSKTITSSDPFRLPAGYVYDNFYVNLVSNIPIRAILLADSPEALKTV